MTTSTPDVTVSIVNWNTKDELRECLESVLSQDGSVSFEVIVIDNASSDGSAAMLASGFADRVTVIENDRNRGFGAAHNQAIARSRGRYLLLLNPDCRFLRRDVLSRMVAYGDANADIGIIGPRILYPDGSLQFSARRFPTILAASFRHTPLGRLFPRNRFVRKYLMEDMDHTRTSDVDWLSGAALMARREMIDQIGPLDERFFMYVEDMDWCKRAHVGRWRVVYYADVEVSHRIGAASDQSVEPMIRAHQRSMLQYFAKWNARSPRILLYLLVALGLWLMAGARISLARRGR